jgi:PAS domain S-box-containing protein
MPSQEVFTTHTAPLCELVAAETDEIEQLIEGTGAPIEELARTGGYVSWESLKVLYDNALRIFGEEALVDFGRRSLQTDASAVVRLMADSHDDPLDFIHWIGDSASLRGITCIEQSICQVGRRELVLESWMIDQYEACEGYWLYRQACLAGVSELYGHGPAVVDVELTASGALFEIRVPEPRSWSRRIRAQLARRRRRRKRDEKFRQAVLAMNRSHLELQNRIADLERRERRLEESQLLFQQAFLESPISMLISREADGRIIAVNRKFTQFSGFSSDEVLGRRATEIGLWPSAGERDRFRTLREVNAGAFDGVETPVRGSDGRDLVVLLSCRSVTLADEPCVLWQAVDITDRKRADERLALYHEELERTVELRNQELEQSRVELRQSDRLATIGTLAAGIAHEINNPIGAIMLESEFALAAPSDAESAATRRAALENCFEQAQRCDEIVRSVLQFSRGVRSKREQEDLCRVVTRGCELVTRYAGENQVTLEIETHVEQLPVSMNVVEIEQVIVNVLRNAVESGSEVTRIWVRMGRRGRRAFVEARDDGPGIERENIPRLFDPFFTTRMGEGGTGLGLSVAHGILVSHGGTISADSSPGRGTCITIELPIVAEDERGQEPGIE